MVFTVVVPVLAMLVYFVAWIAAWAQLGHPPRTYVDPIDGGLVAMMTELTMVSLMVHMTLSAVALPSIFVVMLICFFRRQVKYGLWLLGALLLWMLPMLVWTWDPLRLIDWVLD